MERTNITTPVGRLVAGSPYKGSDKDAEGRPLVVKNGPDAGKPRLDFYFAVAIPKNLRHPLTRHLKSLMNATQTFTMGEALAAHFGLLAES